MFTLLSRERIRKAGLSPAATVSAGPEYFAQFGVVFAREEDDLDSFQFAGISVRGCVIGLVKHDHLPIEGTTILLPHTVSVEQGTALLAEEFSLPIDRFHWSTPTPERHGNFA